MHRVGAMLQSRAPGADSSAARKQQRPGVQVDQRHTGAVTVTDEPFGAALRRLRTRSGLTQEELAARAGLSVRAISALETGQRRRPYPHTVRVLATVLGLSDDDRAALKAGITPRGRPIPPSG